MPSPADHRVKLPLELELRRMIPVAQAAELKAVSEDVFREHYSHLIRQVSPGRQAVKLGDVLAD